jgi:hypothetical protein
MSIRSHPLTLWKDGQFWEAGFLNDPPGTISLYGSSRFKLDTEFTAETIPECVAICPNLTHGQTFAPKRAQDELREAALRYGYRLFEVDIVPW